MLKALVWKELRELLPLVLLFGVLQAFLLSVGTGVHLGFITETIGPAFRGFKGIPFVNDPLCGWLVAVSGVAAVVVGLWQTIWESTRGTYQFLLHRPIQRLTIIGTKLLTGATICFLLAAIPIAYYSLWAAAPGTHASPFFWSMTDQAWQICLLMPLIYLGAFASGLRQVRWYASRFSPLFGVLLVAIFAISISSRMYISTSTASWLNLLSVVFLTGVVFVFGILHVAAKNDFS